LPASRDIAAFELHCETHGITGRQRVPDICAALHPACSQNFSTIQIKFRLRSFHESFIRVPRCGRRMLVFSAWVRKGTDIRRGDFMMTLHRAACTAAPLPRIKLPSCPQCGDMLLAPLLAEHVSAQHVRNHWVCESCGHSFRKSFVVEARIEDELLVD
jgi:hypothetical protein